jgi:CO/xanthine dehydrogenase FAD-binding subunit
VYNTPKRVTAAEDVIKGQTIDETNAEAAGEAAVTGAVGMAENGSNPGNKYKIQVAKALVKRTILACK